MAALGPVLLEESVLILQEELTELAELAELLRAEPASPLPTHGAAGAGEEARSTSLLSAPVS